jgi:hypothetical protein
MFRLQVAIIRQKFQYMDFTLLNILLFWMNDILVNN